MSIILSRQEVFDRVWTDPIQKLAKEFGLSDVGLAKTCRRFEIPVPPRGYWAKKQAGKKVRQIPLPAAAPKGYGDEIAFGARRETKPSTGPGAVVEHPAIVAERQLENLILAPSDDMKITHPLLRSTKAYWRDLGRPSRNWSEPLPKHIQISVSDALRPRVLRVLQALFAAFEARGYDVSTNDRGEAQITVLEEPCVLRVRERQRRMRVERSKPKRDDLFANTRPNDLIYTGELEFRIEERFGRRRSITDKADSRVEERLNEVVIALVHAALAEKDFKARQERERLAQIERERQQMIAHQLELRERARLSRFEHLAGSVSRYKQLLAFRDELRTLVGSEAMGELGAWLDWIDAYLEEVDPLTPFRTDTRKLTLFHCVGGFAVARTLKYGFEDEHSYSDGKDMPDSVPFTDVPMRHTYGESACIAIEVQERDVLPYELVDPDRDHREFRLPAEVANRFDRSHHATA